MTNSLKVKREAIFDMFVAARKRSIILLEMYDSKDIFERDEMLLQMQEHATGFIKAREQLETFTLSVNEIKAVNSAFDIVKRNSRLQQLAIE